MTLKSRPGNQNPSMTEDAGPYRVGLGPRTFLGESRTLDPIIVFIIFLDSSMVEQIFFSPQVKPSMINSNELGLYELPHELLNVLGLRISQNQEISEKSQNFIEFFSYAQSSSRNENFNSSRQKKSNEKTKLNFSRSAVVHMKTRVCLKYFKNDCLWNRFLDTNVPHTPLNLIFLTIFINLMLLRQF